MGRLLQMRQSEAERQAIKDGLAEFEAKLYWDYPPSEEKAPVRAKVHTPLPDEKELDKLRNKAGLSEEEPMVELFNRAGTALIFLAIFLLFLTIGAQVGKFMGWI